MVSKSFEVSKSICGSEKSGKDRALKNVETEHNAASAINVYREYATVREDIINKIGDASYIASLFDDLHKLCFKNVNNEEITRHIMQRVLLGTIINQENENECVFIFNHTDIEIVMAFKNILKILEKNEVLAVAKASIRDRINSDLEKRGLLDTVH